LSIIESKEHKAVAERRYDAFKQAVLIHRDAIICSSFKKLHSYGNRSSFRKKWFAKI